MIRTSAPNLDLKILGLLQSDRGPGVLENVVEMLSNAIEADVRRAQERVALVDAQTLPAGKFARVVIRLPLRGNIGFAYVSGCRYGAGEDFPIEAIAYSTDLRRAKTFGPDSARAVSRQLAGKFGFIGVTMVEEVRS